MSRVLSFGLLGLVMTLVLSCGGGCASIVASGPDKVELTSEPKGAQVTIDGAHVGVTPCVVEVSRKARAIEFCLAGYQTANLPVDRHVNGWLFGNIVFGGIIGIVVDIATGNHMAAEPVMHATLRKAVAQGPPVPSPATNVPAPRVAQGDGGR